MKLLEYLKMTPFWDIAPRILVEVALMMEEVHNSEMSALTRLYGAISQKDIIFIFTALRT
jgi:hypothetical protein